MALQIGAAGMCGFVDTALRDWSLAVVMVVRRPDICSRKGSVFADVRAMRSLASMSHATPDCDKREEESHSLRYEPSTTGMSHQSLHRHLGPERSN